MTKYKNFIDNVSDVHNSDSSDGEDDYSSDEGICVCHYIISQIIDFISLFLASLFQGFFSFCVFFHFIFLIVYLTYISVHIFGM